MTRKEAAKILSEIWGIDYHHYLTEQEACAVDMAIEALKRPTGHWEEVRDMWGDTLWRCDCCGNEWGDPIDNGTYYCPNCGAKMDGKENGI